MHPWRSIFGAQSLRQKDRELLLRFFALHFDLAAYERPLKMFLSNFMRKNRHLELYTSAALDAIFKPTMALANKQLGPKAFRPQRALNASVTDAILAGTAKRIAQGPITDGLAYKHAVESILADPDFADLYSVGTTSKDKVLSRIQRIAGAITVVK